MDVVPCCWRIFVALALFSAGGMSACEAAPSFLRCEFMEAGEIQTRDFHPTLDPYRVQSVSFSENFRFKAVIVGDEQAIEYIALYTYYLGKREPVLLHEVKFRAPVSQSAGSASRSLGTHFVYSPIMGREFRYDCVLREATQ